MSEKALVKSDEEHQKYLENGVRISLWFAHHWSKEHPVEDFRFILEERVDIFCKTDLHDDGLYEGGKGTGIAAWESIIESWLKIKKELVANAHDDFENTAFALVKDRLPGRIERDQNDLHSSTFKEHALKGPFWFDKDLMDPKDLPAGALPTINFHIYNSCYPGSIFDERNYCPRFFLQMMDQAEKKMGAKALSTLTWMNNLLRWNSYFPSEWRKDMSEADMNVMNHLGFWGQIIDSRQTISTSFLDRIRSTGKLPFGMKRTMCSFESMRYHLKEKFGITS